MATASGAAERPRFPLGLATIAVGAAVAGFWIATPDGQALIQRWRVPAVAAAGAAPTAAPTSVAASSSPPASAPISPDAVLVAGGFVDVEGGDRKLSPGIAGIVSEVVAPEGSRVPEGAPLLKLRSKAAEQDLELAQAAFEQADKKLVMARKAAPLRDSRVIEQEQAVQVAASALRNAEENYRRVAGLDPENHVESRLESLRRLVDGARASHEAQRQRLAQLNLEDPNDAVALAAGEVTKARAAVVKAQEQLDLHVLLAPEAGRVLRVFVGKGAGTAPGVPVIVFLPDRPPIARCEVGQEYSRRVAAGQAVEVRPDALDGPFWRGRIVRVGDWIGPRRAPLDEPLERNDVRTLECIVAFDARPEGLRHGERVRVTVLGKPSASESTRANAPPATASTKP